MSRLQERVCKLEDKAKQDLKYFARLLDEQHLKNDKTEKTLNALLKYFNLRAEIIPQIPEKLVLVKIEETPE